MSSAQNVTRSRRLENLIDAAIALVVEVEVACEQAGSAPFLVLGARLQDLVERIRDHGETEPEMSGFPGERVHPKLGELHGRLDRLRELLAKARINDPELPPA